MFTGYQIFTLLELSFRLDFPVSFAHLGFHAHSLTYLDKYLKFKSDLFLLNVVS